MAADEKALELSELRRGSRKDNLLPEGHHAPSLKTSKEPLIVEQYQQDAPQSADQSKASLLASHPTSRAVVQSQAGLKAGYVRSTVISAVIFLVIVGVYGWLYRTHDIHAGSATVQENTCSYIRALDTGVHLLLNIASTLVLGASTFCMQTLCSPTRMEIDKAHQKRTWLDIGLQSRRNFFHVGFIRQFLWILLCASSIFLHYIFNGVFYTSTQTNQYAVALVSPSYLSRSALNATCNSTNPDQFTRNDSIGIELDLFANKTGCPISDLLHAYTRNTSMFEALPLPDCAARYASTLVANSANIILVSNDSTTALEWARWPGRYLVKGTNSYVNEWVCHDSIADEVADRCTTELASRQVNAGNWTVQNHHIQQCLVQPMEDLCKLNFNVFMMLAVVVFTAVNVIGIIVTTILYRRSPFLHTLGDAVASFLHTPDPHSSAMCMATKADLRRYHRKGVNPEPSAPLTGSPRWSQTLSEWRWWGTHIVHLIFAILLAVSLIFAYRGARGTASANGLGAADLQSLEPVAADDLGSSAFLPTVLVANVPQLAYTLLSFLINGMLKNVCLVREWYRYARRRNGLRRFALPFMAYSSIIHWLLSQALFLVQIESKDVYGQVVHSDTITRVGYSVLAIALTVRILLFAQVVVLALGFGKLSGVGLSNYDCHSLTIAAACHPSANEADLYMRQVQWGDVGLAQDTKLASGLPPRHCAFSAGYVTKPVHNALYS